MSGFPKFRCFLFRMTKLTSVPDFLSTSYLYKGEKEEFQFEGWQISFSLVVFKILACPCCNCCIHPQWF